MTLQEEKHQKAMQDLGMQGGRFEIQVQANDKDTLSLHGTDSIEFLAALEETELFNDENYFLAVEEEPTE